MFRACLDFNSKIVKIGTIVLLDGQTHLFHAKAYNPLSRQAYDTPIIVINSPGM
jgi:hypothetical protein